jgi:hypothetical protein
MLSEDGQFIVCNVPDCVEQIRNHRWGKTKASDWFFSRDDKVALCPKHRPHWKK